MLLPLSVSVSLRHDDQPVSFHGPALMSLACSAHCSIRIPFAPGIFTGSASPKNANPFKSVITTLPTASKCYSLSEEFRHCSTLFQLIGKALMVPYSLAFIVSIRVSTPSIPGFPSSSIRHLFCRLSLISPHASIVLAYQYFSMYS